MSGLCFDQPSNQVSACESNSGIKSENTPNPSSASNESYTSNQGQSVESLQGPTVDDDRCRKGFEKRVSLQPGQDLPPYAASTRKSSKTNPMVFPDAAPIQKIGLEDDHRKAAAKVERSNRQESSCVSSVVDDISLEATSFRQLQQVIEQLDVRTKLCIRDSLYRLAKSTEQRHHCMDPNGGNRQVKGVGSHLETGETDKYVGFLDIETDTNPIDRSIAHLLFHRPSDSSLSSDQDVLSYKSHPMSTGAGNGSDLRHPLQTKRRQRNIPQRGSAPTLSDASWSTNFEAGAGSGSDLSNPRAIWSCGQSDWSDVSERGEVPALNSTSRRRFSRAGATKAERGRQPARNMKK
ncbi:hypothetical protein F2Q68_00003985 [Brassica cretica]|uniref:Protein LNK1-like n=1 Tax=Brassica cretica TaxID=69181 RepID=A0A8S9JK52_BRACR|nr:hypothetical protein F2Q68_00003985 [Brassica cretica]